jgi:hypothetical protein
MEGGRNARGKDSGATQDSHLAHRRKVRSAGEPGSHDLLGASGFLRDRATEEGYPEYIGFGFLLPCRMPADARKLKEDAPGACTDSRKPVL